MLPIFMLKNSPILAHIDLMIFAGATLKIYRFFNTPLFAILYFSLGAQNHSNFILFVKW